MRRWRFAHVALVYSCCTGSQPLIPNRVIIPSQVCVRACVRAGVRACVRACVRVCVCACVRVCVFSFTWVSVHACVAVIVRNLPSRTCVRPLLPASTITIMPLYIPFIFSKHSLFSPIQDNTPYSMCWF